MISLAKVFEVYSRQEASQRQSTRCGRDSHCDGSGNLLNAVWKSGTLPIEWQTRVVDPIFKKGGPEIRVCAPIIRVSHHSTSLVKVMPGCWKGGCDRLFIDRL